jgi:ribonuclease HII
VKKQRLNNSEKTYPSFQFEEKLRKEGHHVLAGIDEAGRGPLAGPVVAAACILPYGLSFSGVNDSKKLKHSERERLFDEITAHPEVIWASALMDHDVIDQVNIYQATILAMIQAVDSLQFKPDYLLVDGLKLPHPVIPCQKIIKGDQLSQSIATASILAKVVRDRLMEKYDKEYPEYGFSRHKGYGTRAHIQALKDFGPSPIHRKTFGPVKTEG